MKRIRTYAISEPTRDRISQLTEAAKLLKGYNIDIHSGKFLSKRVQCHSVDQNWTSECLNGDTLVEILNRQADIDIQQIRMSLKSQSEIKPDIGIIDGEMMQHLTTKRGIKTKITKLTNSDRTVVFSTALWYSKKFFFAKINDNDPNSTNHWVSVAIDKNDSVWCDGFDGKVAQTTSVSMTLLRQLFNLSIA